jgi:hypothetical protein
MVGRRNRLSVGPDSTVLLVSTEGIASGAV